MLKLWCKSLKIRPNELSHSNGKQAMAPKTTSMIWMTNDMMFCHTVTLFGLGMGLEWLFAPT